MKKMSFATIDSEETFFASLADGRSIFIQSLVLYERAPEDKRDDPEYWLARLRTGEFLDDENYPLVYILEGNKRIYHDRDDTLDHFFERELQERFRGKGFGLRYVFATLENGAYDWLQRNALDPNLYTKDQLRIRIVESLIHAKLKLS